LAIAVKDSGAKPGGRSLGNGCAIKALRTARLCGKAYSLSISSPLLP
jgi:hypothetical protein